MGLLIKLFWYILVKFYLNLSEKYDHYGIKNSIFLTKLTFIKNIKEKKRTNKKV
jgi:hypothetical protein